MHLQVETYDSKQPGVGCLLLRPDRTVWESQENCCRCLDHRFGEDEFVPVAGTGAKHRRASSTAQQKMSTLYVCGNLKYSLSNLFCLAGRDMQQDEQISSTTINWLALTNWS
jgi:hypothetical protein